MRFPAHAVVAAVAASQLAASLGLAAGPEEVVLRGRAVCLDAAGAPAAEGRDCEDEPPGGWALRDPTATLHRLSSEDQRVAMLSDGRVRSRDLEVVAWRYEDGRLAIVHLYSLIDGRRHDPHYYCSVCAIRANTPGLCWCCQAPFEFREPPVEGSSPLE